MINQGSDVPDKKIAIFYDDPAMEFPKERVGNIISTAPKTRGWFDPHFYKCLPLSIANQYGFIITTEFDFEFEWDGRISQDSLKFYFDIPENELIKLYPRIESHFGHGIITLYTPFSLRTPPGVNLMTINPPNYVVPNITVMTGVVESDNLRRDFTINLKVQIPNMRIRIPKGYPIAGIIPIPRYFSDKFELVDSENIFSESEIIEEHQAKMDALMQRQEIELKHKSLVGRDYFLGRDVYKNNFTDHQNT
jgi:hypothetical protein